MTKILLSPIQNKIVQEISKSFEKFGATSDLLAIVNSWGDTLEENEIFEMLAHWNAVTEPDTLGAHWMNLSTERGRELILAHALIEKLRQELVYFVERVENGTIRSRTTYARFQTALTLVPSDFKNQFVALLKENAVLKQQLSGVRQDVAEQAVLQDPDPLAELARAAKGKNA